MLPRLEDQTLKETQSGLASLRCPKRLTIHVVCGAIREADHSVNLYAELASSCGGLFTLSRKTSAPTDTRVAATMKALM